jgi:chloramphenicol O-acetyltransferase
LKPSFGININWKIINLKKDLGTMTRKFSIFIFIVHNCMQDYSSRTIIELQLFRIIYQSTTYHNPELTYTTLPAVSFSTSILECNVNGTYALSFDDGAGSYTTDLLDTLKNVI